MELNSPVKLVPARLVLKNGEVYEGVSPDWRQDDVYGEVVFTTGMMGYVESLTASSYQDRSDHQHSARSEIKSQIRRLHHPQIEHRSLHPAHHQSAKCANLSAVLERVKSG